MTVRNILFAALLAGASAVHAEVARPDGDRGFRNIYPVSASIQQTDRAYHADLKTLAREAARLEADDGGVMSDDHRTYVETRRALIEQRYNEATGRSSS